jgi:hypothetical protein
MYPLIKYSIINSQKTGIILTGYTDTFESHIESNVNSCTHRAFHCLVTSFLKCLGGWRHRKCPAACRLIVLPYILDVTTFTVRCSHAHKRREWSQAVRGGICRPQMTGNFSDNGDFHDITRIFYMPQICDIGPTALLPSEGRRAEGFISTWKIRQLRPDSYPRTRVPKASAVTSRTAFFKHWFVDHKWSSGSALVVLGLTFYEINYPAYIDVLL